MSVVRYYEWFRSPGSKKKWRESVLVDEWVRREYKMRRIRVVRGKLIDYYTGEVLQGGKDWWKGFVQPLPSRIPANRVPRMPDNSPEEIEQSLPPKRGWKTGNTHNARTRAKISHTRAEQERLKREARKNQLPTTSPTLSDTMRDAIVERDGLECRSCGEDGPKLKVMSFINGLNDLNALERDPELHAVMCSFCRDVAATMDATNMGDLLRNRW